MTLKNNAPLGQRQLENRRERSTVHTLELHINIMHHNQMMFPIKNHGLCCLSYIQEVTLNVIRIQLWVFNDN